MCHQNRVFSLFIVVTVSWNFLCLHQKRGYHIAFLKHYWRSLPDNQHILRKLLCPQWDHLEMSGWHSIKCQCFSTWNGCLGLHLFCLLHDTGVASLPQSSTSPSTSSVSLDTLFLPLSSDYSSGLIQAPRVEIRVLGKHQALLPQFLHLLV